LNSHHESPVADAAALKSKVVWSEGMYLRPQHFQQLERYFEHYIQQRCAAPAGAFWGFSRLDIDEDALALGKLAIVQAHGVFPDGTPFALASADDLPAPFDVPDDCNDELLALALPVRRPGGEDMIFDEQPESLARYSVFAREVADGNAVALGPAAVRLVRAAQAGSEWQTLGVVRVQERRGDNQLVLDRRYIPPALTVAAHPVLAGYVRELHGMLDQRGAALAQRLSQPGRGGVSEVAEFLLLALINRAQAATWHAQQRMHAHPEQLFRDWLQLAFDLCTYTAAERRPAVWPAYRHDDLQNAFEPLIVELRRSLSTVLQQNAVAIELIERARRVWVAQVPNPELLQQAAFVLAVRADLPAEQVRTLYPAQVKIGPVERIGDLVNLHLPGIALRPLPVAPRQIPYHAGHHYFELDTGSELWKQLMQSNGLALHVAGDLPGLAMECWAIRA
jgi:type VI secretion system protein ImpJ